MKKILSILVVSMLLISATGLAFNIIPKAASVGTWRLDVFTSPAIVNTYIPGGILGAGDYPPGWSGPLTAPTPVYNNVSGFWYEGWDFLTWEINGTAVGGNPYTVGPGSPAYVAGDYVNATAVYRTWYYLRVNSPYGLPTSGEGWYLAGATAYADIFSSSQWISYGVNWLFDRWSGDASGSGLTSNAILMNGPRTANALWYVNTI